MKKSLEWEYRGGVLSVQSSEADGLWTLVGSVKLPRGAGTARELITNGAQYPSVEEAFEHGKLIARHRIDQALQDNE